MVRTLAALAILSSASAFQAGQRSPQRTASSLRAFEAEDFQRSLLAEAERLGATKAVVDDIEKMDFVATSWEETTTELWEDMKAVEQEKFQRSLLEAKLAYDAVNAALGAPAEEVPEPEPAASAKTAEETKALERERFQRSLLAARLAYDAVAAAKPSKAREQEKFQRSLLQPPKPAEVELLAEAVGDVGGADAAATSAFALAIVPVNESNVRFAAGALGAAAGLALGGPALGALAAALCNYLSRKDEDRSPTGTPSAKMVIDAAARTALLAYNFLAQFDKDHKVVEATLKLAGEAVDKAKERAGSADTFATVESTLGGIASKVEEWNEEYDLVGGAGTVLDGVGAVVETCVDKGLELNDEYKLTDRAGGVVKGAADKVTERVISKAVKLQ